jgi:hypothetical protein
MQQAQAEQEVTEEMRKVCIVCVKLLGTENRSITPAIRTHTVYMLGERRFLRGKREFVNQPKRILAFSRSMFFTRFDREKQHGFLKVACSALGCPCVENKLTT